MKIDRDGLASPTVLRAKAKKIREEFVRTGEPQTLIAMRVLRGDPSLEGLAEWIFVGLARGLAISSSLVETNHAKSSAIGLRNARTLKDKRDFRLALLYTSITVGGRAKERFTAPLSMWMAHKEERHSEEMGARSDQEHDELVIELLEYAHANTIGQLSRDQQYRIADDLATRRGASSAIGAA